MATSGQGIPEKTFNKSGHKPPPPPKYYKPRSNSFSDTLEQTDGTADSTSHEKLAFHDIRKKFEASKPPEIPPSTNDKRKSSVSASPTVHTNKFTFPVHSKHHQTRVTTTTRSVLISSQVTQKAKSTSPPPPARTSEGRVSSLLHPLTRLTLHSTFYNENNSSIDDPDDLSSPLPNSNDSSQISENDNHSQRSSVRKIRDLFDKPSSRHVYQSSQATHPVATSPEKRISNSTQAPRQPLLPTRASPRPEQYIKSQINGWTSVPSVETAESVTGGSSLSSNPNLSECNPSYDSFTDEEEEEEVLEEAVDDETSRKIKLRKCIEEVHTTEKTYVNILYVLSVKLSAEVKNTCDKDDNAILTFNNTYRPLLGNIQQIYQLHHDHILPEIEDYITGHRTGNMWSVFEQRYKFIEILYKNYYVSYYDIQGKLEELCKSHPLINEAMLKCQVHLGNLYPLTQLNCPNQRLLRYILCLKTYLKYLTENSSEYKHTLSIHDELDRIAVRCEEELVISAAQLNELKERLEHKFECFKDHRKLLWHGSIKKQSPRKHLDLAQRYVILFSDCILVCGEEYGKKLEIKRELSMRGITVDVVPGGRMSLAANSEQSSSANTYYPFRVNAVEKSYEFLVDKESDREIWVKKIRQASDDYNKRTTTFQRRNTITHIDEQQLGERAPAWVNDIDVSRCQNCNNRFPAAILSSRRHHCRSCGRCICGPCSSKKLILAYCSSNGEMRVCDTCYTHFTGTVLSKNTSIWPKPTREMDQTILFGDFRTVNSGTTIWIALQEDFLLHVYTARLDQAEDYAIKLADLLDFRVERETRIFTLRESLKVHVFTIEVNHQLTYPRTDALEEQLKNSESKLAFYTDLWHEAMRLARSTTLPEWYLRKRDSSDSGVSNVG